jgi:parvulin-like peptidyl-prolyl isomerase
MGLADNDPIIRTRLAEKMVFVLGAQQVPPEPDDAALRALYEANQQDYTQQARVTLRQLFVADPSPQGRARAELLLRRADAGEPLDALTAAADEPPGGPVLRGRTPESLASLFGPSFTEGLEDTAVGSWVLRTSPTGWHVVQVVDRLAGGPLAFDAVRARLVVRWHRAHVETARNKAVGQLRAKAVVQGWPR